jgi:hypothetical protein
MIAAPPQSWQRNSSSEPEPEPEPSSEGAGKAFRRAEKAGRGFGLFAERPISAGEVLREEMPLVAAQDPAGAAVLPACIVCLRPCGTPRQALRHVLGLVGVREIPRGCTAPPEDRCDEGDNDGSLRCPSCAGPLCCPECRDRGRAHMRLCCHPAGGRLKELAATASDSVWLASLCVADIVIAVEDSLSSRPSVQQHQGSGLRVLLQAQAHATVAERQRRFGQLHTVPWEDMPRWSLRPRPPRGRARLQSLSRPRPPPPADGHEGGDGGDEQQQQQQEQTYVPEPAKAAAAAAAAAAEVEKCCRLRRCIVEEVSQLLGTIFPGGSEWQWDGIAGCDSVSALMGTMDSSCILPWIKCDTLNTGWADQTNHSSTAAGAMNGTGGAVSVDAEVQQMVVSIHEAVQRSFEDTEDSSSGSGSGGTLAAAVSYPAGRWLADLTERRAEPLWHRGLPPIDGAALYSTGAQMNHSCVPNVDYTWRTSTLCSSSTIISSSAKATFKANRAIRAGEELTIAYCDIAQDNMHVSVRRRRLLEDFGFVCHCERCTKEGGGERGDNVTAADLLQPPPPPPPPPSAVPEPEPEPGGGGGDDADPAVDSDDGVSRTEQQQRLFDAAMRIHKEKFGHRGGWWHRPTAPGSTSSSDDDDDGRSGGGGGGESSESSGSTAHGWSQGQTSSGSSYWSFTDSSGKARVSFTQPTVTPTEWLKLQ